MASSADDRERINPKDAIGYTKVPLSCVPAPVLMEVALAMLEGALKYGRHNYRVAPVRAGIYYDAAQRHLTAWWEGEDIDPASGVSHLSKAIATLVVARDAQMHAKMHDDRPPQTAPGWIEKLNEQAKALIGKYPEAPMPYTQNDPTLHELHDVWKD